MQQHELVLACNNTSSLLKTIPLWQMNVALLRINGAVLRIYGAVWQISLSVQQHELVLVCNNTSSLLKTIPLWQMNMALLRINGAVWRIHRVRIYIHREICDTTHLYLCDRPRMEISLYMLFCEFMGLFGGFIECEFILSLVQKQYTCFCTREGMSLSPPPTTTNEFSVCDRVLWM